MVRFLKDTRYRIPIPSGSDLEYKMKRSDFNNLSMKSQGKSMMTFSRWHKGVRLVHGAVCFAFLLAALPAAWAGTLVEFSVSAAETAPNDLAQATVFAEGTAPTLKALAQQINPLIAQANKQLESYPQIERKSGPISTYPSRVKNRITQWMMRSELKLESRDIDAISEVLGQLQESLAIGGLHFVPTPETRTLAEGKATQKAIAAFQAQAKEIAAVLGKPYVIKRLNIQTADKINRVFFEEERSVSFSRTAAALPVEAGESRIEVIVSGQIELAD
jgi:predicted secreted protein